MHIHMCVRIYIYIYIHICVCPETPHPDHWSPLAATSALPKAR